jgi:hypothetical protein
MATISGLRIQQFEDALNAAETTPEKGRAFEDLIAYVFGRVPGISLTFRDALNVFASEELDLAFWNTQHRKGFYFLPNIILVECKNWSHPVGSNEVSWFDAKLRRRSRTHGVLLAADGVTGSALEVSAAHDIVRTALTDGRHIVVITLLELLACPTTEAIVQLVQAKLCEMVVSGTVILK